MPERTDPPGGYDDELAELRALASDLDPAGITWEEPPADLWDRIAAEAGVVPAADVSGDRAGDSATTATVTALDPSRRSDRDGARRADPDGGRRAGRARRGAPWLLAAAAAVAALVVGGVVWMGQPQDPTSIASVSLDLLGDQGEGTAELVDDDGTLQLRVETADLDAGDGFVEVWVIDPEVSKLVSLGPLRPDGRYDLPDGLDPEDFPIVDVSYEPLDGDPTHSGDSVLRGRLEF